MNHTPQESRERVIREFRERFGNSPDDEEGYWIPDTTRHADATPTTWEDIETFLTSALAVECAIAERHATHSLITHAMQQIEAEAERMKGSYYKMGLDRALKLLQRLLPEQKKEV